MRSAKGTFTELGGMSLGGAPTHRKISERFSSVALEESPCEDSSIATYLFDKGLGQGLFSDVRIKAFSKTYALHRIILYRSSYFASMLSGLWNEGDKDKVYELEFEGPYATQKAFEDVLSRMYGRGLKISPEDSDDASEADLSRNSLANTTVKEDSPLDGPFASTIMATRDTSIGNLSSIMSGGDDSSDSFSSAKDEHDESSYAIDDLLGVFTVADFLDLPWLVSETTTILIKKLNERSIYSLVEFCSKYYGGAREHDRLSEATRCFICMEGYAKGVEWWLKFSCQTIEEVLRSDGFFVPSEMERCDFIVLFYYKVAKRRDDLEEASDILKVLQHCLNTSTYYCHFPYKKLFNLSKLTDYAGSGPLIKPEVLQRALWLQNELQHRIINCTEYSSPHLGLTEDNFEGEEAYLHNVPQDDSTIDSGQGGEQSVVSSPQRNSESATESCLKIRTRFAPFRFAVEFHDVFRMPVNKRQYSASQWYAGSYWNVYIQRVQYRKGGYQLGVYLHRAGQESKDISDTSAGLGLLSFRETSNRSSTDIQSTVNFSSFGSPSSSFPPTGSPTGVYGNTSANIFNPTNNPRQPFYSSVLERSSSTSRPTLEPTPDLPNSPQNSYFEESKYQDKRKEVRAYFEMYTPARRSKTALTCFSSVPDNFADSQSWGWKSSSLWSFVVGNPNESLKFVISLGVV